MKEFTDKLISRLLLESSGCRVYKLINPNIEDITEFNAYKKCIEIVNQLAEEYGKDTNVTTNDWIPCSERLPKYLENVLICTETGFVTIAYMQGEIYGNSWADGLGLIREVIAWQPLPQPYKEGE